MTWRLWIARYRLRLMAVRLRLRLMPLFIAYYRAKRRVLGHF